MCRRDDLPALLRVSAVPGMRGDIVFFNLCTVHGSYINQTDKQRRLVRVCYRNPGKRASVSL